MAEEVEGLKRDLHAATERAEQLQARLGDVTALEAETDERHRSFVKELEEALASREEEKAFADRRLATLEAELAESRERGRRPRLMCFSDASL